MPLTDTLPARLGRAPALTAGVLVAIAMAFGFYLRTIQLGAPSFNEDELFHVRAAQSINETGRPTLPGGQEYRRALPFTHLMAAVFRSVGESEQTARFPAVVFGTLLIWLTYILGARMADRPTGVLAAFLIAVSPFAILLSRFARMYTPHQCLYLLAFLLFYCAYEKEDLKTKRFLLKIAGASAILVLSVEIHDIAAFFVVGLFGYCIWRTFLTAYLERDWRKAYRSRYGVSVAVMTVIGLTALALPSVREEIAESWGWLPEWAQGNKGNIFFYRWFLRNEYGLWSYMIFPGAIWLALRRPGEGAYLVSHFVLPVLVLMIWPLKHTRYFAHLLPLFLVLLACGFRGVVGGTLRLALEAWHNRGGPISEPTARILSAPVFIATAVLAVVLTAGVSTPASVRAGNMGTSAAANFLPWREAGTYLKVNAGEDDVIIASRPPMVLYYFGRVSYSIDRQGDVEIRSFGYRNPDGRLMDNTGGVPYIEDRDQFKSAIATDKTVWLALQKSLFKADRQRLSREEKTIIERDFELAYTSDDESILIYRRQGRRR